MSKFTGWRTLLFILVGVTILCCPAAQSQKKSKKRVKTAPKPALVISYKKEIFPVFKTYCLPCHTEDQMNPSELYLDTYEGLMNGGKHGKPLIAANPDSSLLMLKLGAKSPFGDPMPLKRKTLMPQDTVDILRKWIGQGAKNN